MKSYGQDIFDKIVISEPARGATLMHNVEFGQVIHLDMPVDDVVFSRNDLALHMESHSGGTVILENFFVAEGNNGLPDLQLRDGYIVNSAELFETLSLGLATGPGHACEEPFRQYSMAQDLFDGSGAGELIGGLSAPGHNEPIFLEDVLDTGSGLNFDAGGISFLDLHEFNALLPDASSSQGFHTITALDLVSGPDDLSVLADSILPHIL